MREAKFNFQFHPSPREIAPGFQTLSLSKGATRKLIRATVRPISYTSDFVVYCNNGMKVYIEAKGFFHRDARLRYKLFQASLQKNEITLLAYDKAYKKDNLKDMRAIIKIINDEFDGSTLADPEVKVKSIANL